VGDEEEDKGEGESLQRNREKIWGEEVRSVEVWRVKRCEEICSDCVFGGKRGRSPRGELSPVRLAHGSRA
jgi:hypothetical protein